ncbi:hypothetical protein K443DRAFT_583294 [Laccaria amethystina LaAM-08-1]|uniref:Uncharacterized protein n=1 Tax=Laccaria amethystina LaAM-08-1 TaxID=1095629 RepID=A0A0C9XTJ6_9AGAR|nr:hypothetical protein K443DRAFT_583294 [Laccaria amethystina LaAM-08-1]
MSTSCIADLLPPSLLRLKRPVFVNPILNAATINTLFVPTLTEEGSKSVSALIVLPDVFWSTGCAVTTADWPGKRFSFESGLASTYHLFGSNHRGSCRFWDTAFRAV